MKKASILFMALAIAIAFSSSAFAKQGFTVGIGFGFFGDAAGMGGTILDDGLSKSYNSTAVNALNPAITAQGYDEFTLIESEQGLLDQQTSGDITNVKTGGAMTAVNMDLKLRYDIFYFFAETGFQYSMKAMGGETSWVAGGVKQEQEWDYSHIMVPFTLGINVPVMDGKVNVYAGFTLSYMYGGWNVKLTRSYLSGEMDDTGTTLAEAITGGWAMAGLTSITEKPEFKVHVLGMGYKIGIDAEVYKNVLVYFEINAIGGAKIKQYNVKDATMVASGVTHFNYTAILGGTSFNLGAKYRIF